MEARSGGGGAPETDGAGEEYARSRSLRPLGELRAEAPADLTVPELRVRVAREAALNTNPRTPFTKQELNSIHACLSGEHFFPHLDYFTPRAPDHGQLRAAVADVGDLEVWPAWPDDRENAAAPPDRTRFYHAELVELCQVIEERGDKRTQ